MTILTSALIKKGMDLEAARRLPPMDEQGRSKDWERSNKEYGDFLMRHGYLILQELDRHIKE